MKHFDILSAIYIIAGLFLSAFILVISKFLVLYRYSFMQSGAHTLWDMLPSIIWAIPLMLLMLGFYYIYNARKNNSK